MYSPVGLVATWFHDSLFTISWYLCSFSRRKLSKSRSLSSRSGRCSVRTTLSLEFNTISRPDGVSRMEMMRVLLSRSECRVSHVSVSMMLSHPLFVPAMMWRPEGEKAVTVVSCLASWVSCFSVAFSRSVSVRLGAEGRIRLLISGPEMSTRTGWSSKRAAAKRRLWWGLSALFWSRGVLVVAVLVRWVELRNEHWSFEPYCFYPCSIFEIPEHALPVLRRAQEVASICRPACKSLSVFVLESRYEWARSSTSTTEPVACGLSASERLRLYRRRRWRLYRLANKVG